jgi:hypothetical protein
MRNINTFLGMKSTHSRTHALTHTRHGYTVELGYNVMKWTEYFVWLICTTEYLTL